MAEPTLTCLTFHSTPPGELAPPPPRACFGRDDLIEKVVGLAENLIPIALIGAGGIGKTSIALSVLHHDRIKQRFGDNRRFIRCDQFPSSRAHFLNRLSKVIGAGVDNPEDLTPLRPFLSSMKIILVLDNAESILDPQAMGAQEVYTTVEELSRFETVCLCITSRISTVPRYCKRPIIPTLSMESACDIFYGIYDNGGRSDTINDLLRRLDFHALSITLLATTASHNMWDHDRLAREWDARRVQVLRTDYDESLAATIDLSLASPTFHKLGPHARDLLSVIAFFPQGIDESNLDWLFPAISNRRDIFDKFSVPSLTYRNNGFTTMLAPLRGYLYPKDPAASPLVHTTKQRYIDRLSVDIHPSLPGFDEAKWIKSEDVNIEHLLDVFTTIDGNSNDVWDACYHFMDHLYWHKRRLVVLGPKIEGLLDCHPSKPQCLFQLSQLLESAGNRVGERKELLTQALKLWRERGDDFYVAQVLGFVSDANRWLGLYEEGVQQVIEALEIFERLDDRSGQARAWQRRAWLLYDDHQFDPAEEAASQAINLFLDEGDQFWVCKCHRVLGLIHSSKGEAEKAIDHLETALGGVSSSWQYERFWIHYSLSEVFFGENRFDEAHDHIERAKSHAFNDYSLGRAMEVQARFWYNEDRYDEARAEALHAAETYERIGATGDMEDCRAILRSIEEIVSAPVASGALDFSGVLLGAYAY